MKKISLLALAVLAYTSLLAQSFLTPVGGMIGKQEGYVVLLSGDTLQGKLTMATQMNGLLKTFTFVTTADEKRKLKAEEVQCLWLKAGTLAKLEAMSEASRSLKRMASTDFDQIMNREYIVYERALLPGKKEKYALLQLLNPGFDHTIKVYEHPNGGETAETSIGGLTVSGGEDKSYLVVKNGAQAQVVKKRTYTESFAWLFGDCPDMVRHYSEQNEKISFWDFASHTFDYDQTCQ
ncbi:hypothetical protein QWY31_14295 [Cytophagales bacterium LB-30]|uniref:Uncharacterized protein n=1 Tax=Shiella aurantiaca TaxID=3058365 RepID=A0ABT8F863_9BACT|nr:hypothetical protein [Shiella aurantiaca]MDN4166677.1 hypothetical protein [Shiella aurantiaca]